MASPDGAVWIGTANGLSRFRDGRFDTWRKRDGLSSDEIVSLHVSQDRRGLDWNLRRRTDLVFLDSRFTNCTTGRGLPDDLIYSVAEDGQGSFWMTSRTGVIRIRQEDLLAAMNGARLSLSAHRDTLRTSFSEEH